MLHLWLPVGDFAASWSGQRRYEPQMPPAERDRKYRLWQDAVARTLLRT